MKKSELKTLEVRIGDNGIVQLNLETLSAKEQKMFGEALGERFSHESTWLVDGKNPKPCYVLNSNCDFLDFHRGSTRPGPTVNPE